MSLYYVHLDNGEMIPAVFDGDMVAFMDSIFGPDDKMPMLSILRTIDDCGTIAVRTDRILYVKKARGGFTNNLRVFTNRRNRNDGNQMPDMRDGFDVREAHLVREILSPMREQQLRD